MSLKPYRSTAVFDDATLPAALRSTHMTKPGVWGVIRVLEGTVRYTELDPPAEHILTTERPGLVHPERPHFVTPLEPMRMRIDFYNARPDI